MLASMWLTHRYRAQARSHRRNAITKSQVGYQAASWWTLISGAPLTTMPSFRHAEPKRGTEWWGKSVLLTFALFKSEPL
ncbi:hypothetical protein [Pseudomonas sp. H3_H05]